MNEKIINVSVGIPAYNEEGNIKTLIENLLQQKEEKFLLKEIIVVSDASTDGTVQKIKEVNDPRIKIIENKERIGQAPSQNKILDAFSGDILVLLNADVLPADESFLNDLVKPFSQSDKIGIVAPDLVAVKAQTFFERIINYSLDFKKEMFRNWENGNNLFLCYGAARAIRKDLAKSFKWPTSVSEDAYSYLSCLNAGYEFKYLPEVKIFYKSPDKLSDHLKQSTRFIHGPKTMSNYFPPDLVRSNYALPYSLTFKYMLKYFFKNPILFMSYLGVFGMSFMRSFGKSNAKNLWSTSPSSKKLNLNQ